MPKALVKQAAASPPISASPPTTSTLINGHAGAVRAWLPSPATAPR